MPRYRSSVTGNFITEAEAKASDPGTWTAEDTEQEAADRKLRDVARDFVKKYEEVHSFSGLAADQAFSIMYSDFSAFKMALEEAEVER